MNQKKSEKQNSHDACVKAIANELKNDNWDVKASLEGWDKPNKLGNSTPDIEAKKGCLKRICEVATEDMLEGDKERYIEFKNYCDEYDFHFYIVDKDGRRRQIDPKTFGKNSFS